MRSACTKASSGSLFLSAVASARAFALALLVGTLVRGHVVVHDHREPRERVHFITRNVVERRLLGLLVVGVNDTGEDEKNDQSSHGKNSDDSSLIGFSFWFSLSTIH
jgi:hypothetical protein